MNLPWEAINLIKWASLSNILEQDIINFQINEDKFVKEYQKR